MPTFAGLRGTVIKSGSLAELITVTGAGNTGYSSSQSRNALASQSAPAKP
jgi:hypothetical protein